MSHRGAAAYSVFAVDFDVTGQQVLDDIDMANPGGHVQRRAAQLQRRTGSNLCHTVVHNSHLRYMFPRFPL